MWTDRAAAALCPGLGLGFSFQKRGFRTGLQPLREVLLCGILWKNRKGLWMASRSTGFFRGPGKKIR